MNKAFLIVSLVLLASMQPLKSASAEAADSTARFEDLIDSTLAETYNYRFHDALETTSEMINSHPDLPEGYLYRCGVYWKMMEEGCASPSDSTMKRIKVLVDQACRLSSATVDSGSNDVRALFYYAGALVYRARYEMMKSDWLAVMSDGLKTRKLLEKAVQIDSSFYDAYSGIGAFNYYAAHIPWYLKPIALVMGISGNEEAGINQLKIAARLGRYSRTEAAEFLASVVYPNKGEFRHAVRLMLDLHREYPDNLNFVRTICSTYYRMGKYEEAIHYADRALTDAGEIDTCCGTSLAYIRFYRGASYEGLKDDESAIADFTILAEMKKKDYACRQARTELDKLRHRKDRK